MLHFPSQSILIPNLIRIDRLGVGPLWEPIYSYKYGYLSRSLIYTVYRTSATKMATQILRELCVKTRTCPKSETEDTLVLYWVTVVPAINTDQLTTLFMLPERKSNLPIIRLLYYFQSS